MTSILAGWGLVASSSIQASSMGAVTSAASNWASAPAATSSENGSAVAAPGSTTSVTTAGASTVTTTTLTSTATTATTTTQAGGASFGAGASTSSATTEGPGALAALSTNVSSQGEPLLREVQRASLLLAPVSWVVLGGMWVWRGRVRARYSELGFGSDVFELFMKMKGGATRIKVLNKLGTPKDRLQLAEELGVDWKTVDRHVQILNKYGFVSEQAAYGTVRLYEVTPMGKMLLDLFEDLERTDGPVAQQPPKSLGSQDEANSGS